MSDKSPRQKMSTKTTKTIKEKRRDKHAAQPASGVEKLTAPTKGGRPR
ncbi:MAG: hypothetical protein M9891_06190 [Austwickia sp.]|nr:hypothetical protein [Actinomycetota bacterium]MCB1255386.1 hypothetical protein [Austwickia sp.]MCO5308869.1 hypothetical protein [Austwickia sp.]